MECSNCGNKINDGDKFCMNCGTKVEVKEEIKVESVQSVQMDEVALNNYHNNPYQKANKTRKKLIISIIVMGIIIFAGLLFALWYFVIRNDNSNNNVTTNTNANTNIVTNTNINNSNNHDVGTYLPTDNISEYKYKSVLTKRNKLLIFTKNTTKETSDLKIEVEFYDSEDNLVGNDRDYVTAIAPGQEIVSQMYSTPLNFDHIKVNIESSNSYYKSYFDKVSYTSKDDKDRQEIMVQVVNNSDEKLTNISVGVVFYNKNEIVGYDSDYVSNIEAGKSAPIKIYYPYDSNYKDVYFDDYEIFINESYLY